MCCLFEYTKPYFHMLKWKTFTSIFKLKSSYDEKAFSVLKWVIYSWRNAWPLILCLKLWLLFSLMVATYFMQKLQKTIRVWCITDTFITAVTVVRRRMNYHMPRFLFCKRSCSGAWLLLWPPAVRDCPPQKTRQRGENDLHEPHAADLLYKLYLSPADENVFPKVGKSRFDR